MKEIEPWSEARLVCGIGHEYGGLVRVVQDQGRDMDGELLWLPPRKDYDPPKCIVCGLLTYRAK